MVELLHSHKARTIESFLARHFKNLRGCYLFTDAHKSYQTERIREWYQHRFETHWLRGKFTPTVLAYEEDRVVSDGEVDDELEDAPVEPIPSREALDREVDLLLLDGGHVTQAQLRAEEAATDPGTRAALRRARFGAMPAWLRRDVGAYKATRRCHRRRGRPFPLLPLTSQSIERVWGALKRFLSGQLTHLPRERVVQRISDALIHYYCRQRRPEYRAWTYTGVVEAAFTVDAWRGLAVVTGTKKIAGLRRWREARGLQAPDPTAASA